MFYWRRIVTSHWYDMYHRGTMRGSFPDAYLVSGEALNI